METSGLKRSRGSSSSQSAAYFDASERQLQDLRQRLESAHATIEKETRDPDYLKRLSDLSPHYNTLKWLEAATRNSDPSFLRNLLYSPDPSAVSSRSGPQSFVAALPVSDSHLAGILRDALQGMSGVEVRRVPASEFEPLEHFEFALSIKPKDRQSLLEQPYNPLLPGASASLPQFVLPPDFAASSASSESSTYSTPSITTPTRSASPRRKSVLAGYEPPKPDQWATYETELGPSKILRSSVHGFADWEQHHDQDYAAQPAMPLAKLVYDLLPIQATIDYETKRASGTDTVSDWVIWAGNVLLSLSMAKGLYAGFKLAEASVLLADEVFTVGVGRGLATKFAGNPAKLFFAKRAAARELVLNAKLYANKPAAEAAELMVQRVGAAAEKYSTQVVHNAWDLAKVGTPKIVATPMQRLGSAAYAAGAAGITYATAHYANRALSLKTSSKVPDWVYAEYPGLKNSKLSDSELRRVALDATRSNLGWLWGGLLGPGAAEAALAKVGPSVKQLFIDLFTEAPKGVGAVEQLVAERAPALAAKIGVEITPANISQLANIVVKTDQQSAALLKASPGSGLWKAITQGVLAPGAMGFSMGFNDAAVESAASSAAFYSQLKTFTPLDEQARPITSNVEVERRRRAYAALCDNVILQIPSTRPGQPPISVEMPALPLLLRDVLYLQDAQSDAAVRSGQISVAQNNRFVDIASQIGVSSTDCERTTILRNYIGPRYSRQALHALYSRFSKTDSEGTATGRPVEFWLSVDGIAQRWLSNPSSISSEWKNAPAAFQEEWARLPSISNEEERQKSACELVLRYVLQGYISASMLSAPAAQPEAEMNSATSQPAASEARPTTEARPSSSRRRRRG